MMATTNPIACAVRDRAISLMPITQFVNFYMRIKSAAR